MRRTLANRMGTLGVVLDANRHTSGTSGGEIRLRIEPSWGAERPLLPPYQRVSARAAGVTRPACRPGRPKSCRLIAP